MFEHGNVKGTLKGDILTLEIDVSKNLGPSKSGKTMIIATTAGNKPVTGKEGVIIGVNCYTHR